MDDLNRKRHAVYKLTYHAVFVIKYRRRVMTEPMTCKIECEKVKKIIDNITCPIWICGGSDTVEGCMGRGTERGCLSKVR